MNISIKSRGFALSDALRRYAERRLRFALPLESTRIQHVALDLADVNGPRGGVDKKCRVRVVLSGRATLVIEDTQPDAYVAIDRASERMAVCMYRVLDKTKQRARTGLVLPVEEAAH